MTVGGIDSLRPSAIIISPGPGRPEDAGICVELVRELRGKYPILGVCLGHQAICKAYGATVTYAKKLMHGKQSVVTVVAPDTMFEGLPEEMRVARYHSLAADRDTLPDDLLVTAVADDGEVMAVVSKDGMVHGVQFHPESIMTPDGRKMMENFLRITKEEE